MRCFSISTTFVLFLVVPVSAAVKQPKESGVFFRCDPASLKRIRQDMAQYFVDLDFPFSEILLDTTPNSLRYHLNSRVTDTMGLAKNKKLDIHPDILSITRSDGKVIQGAFTSRKEILASMMQNGREYVLTGGRCSVAALQEHIGVRQNIVKWNKVAQERWIFPEKWEDGKLVSLDTIRNEEYWQTGFVPRPGKDMLAALADPFIGDFQYWIYCLDAGKLVMAQGVFDYFHKVAPNKAKLRWLRAAADGNPLEDIKPSYDEKDRMIRPGKYFRNDVDVPPDNWWPGDRGYLWNRHAGSAMQPGYEGSNFVYEGGGYISNFWADNPEAGQGSDYYHGASRDTLDLRLIKYYQMRFGIMENYENDPRRAFLTTAEVEALRKPPEEGGLLGSFRTVWADGVYLPNGQTVQF